MDSKWRSASLKAARSRRLARLLVLKAGYRSKAVNFPKEVNVTPLTGTFRRVRRGVFELR